MSLVIAAWILWAVLGLVLLGLIMYRGSIVRYEEDQLFLEGDDTFEHRQQAELLKKAKRIEPIIRIFGSAEGLVTLGIVGFYLMDALRQF